MPKKNIEYHEALLKNLPQAYRKWFEADRRYLIKNIKKDSKVLDVGCGYGRGLRYILKITQNLVGIDHNKTAVEHAKNNFKKYPKVKIILGEASNLPFKDNSFDHIICIGTLVNFGKEKEKALREMKRVLKKDGNIIISVFSEDAFSERLKLYQKLKTPIKEIKKDGTVIFDFDASLGDNISEQFSEGQLKTLFKKVKLQLEEIKKVGIGYICKLAKP